VARQCAPVDPGGSKFSVFPYAVPAEFGVVAFSRPLGAVGALLNERSFNKDGSVDSSLTGGECPC